MELLLLVPKRMTLAKAFFLSLSSRWNIPEGEEGHAAFEIPAPTTQASRPPQSHPLTSDEVAAHEGLGELFREAILRVPQGPAILIKVIPKVRQRHGERILVGVLALKFIQHKGTARRG